MRYWMLAFWMWLMAAGAAQADWRVATTEHLEVYSEMGDRDLAAYANKLERYDQFLRIMSNTPLADALPTQRLKVFVVPDYQAVQKALGGNAKLVAGFYTTEFTGAMAVMPRPTFDDGDVILFHEYAHHFMLHHFSAAYPSWYIEGFAEYFGESEFRPDGKVVAGAPASFRIDKLQQDGVMNLSEMLALDEPSQEKGKDGKPKAKRIDVLHFYATAWLMTHFFELNPARKPELIAYLRAFAAGQKEPEKAFKGGIAGLNKDMRTYWAGRNFKQMDLTIPNLQRSFAVQIAPVPADRAAMIDYEIPYLRGLSKEEAEKMIPQVTSAAAALPSSAHAATLLAQYQARAQRFDDAIATADQVLVANPDYVPALWTRGDATIDRALKLKKDKKEDPEAGLRAAKPFIIKANRLEPDNPVPLFLNYDVNRHLGIPITENMFEGLLKAQALLPQFGYFRYRVAAEFARQGDTESAINAIKPAAFQPHGSPDSDARKLLAGLEKRLAGEEISDEELFAHEEGNAEDDPSQSNDGNGDSSTPAKGDQTHPK